MTERPYNPHADPDLEGQPQDPGATAPSDPADPEDPDDGTEDGDDGP